MALGPFPTAGFFESFRAMPGFWLVTGHFLQQDARPRRNSISITSESRYRCFQNDREVEELILGHCWS